MIICKLIDSIWATRKYEELDGMKLMRVEVIDGPESGRRLVCVDTIGAGTTEDCLLTIARLYDGYVLKVVEIKLS